MTSFCKYKNGLIFGKFAPLTQGHINFINTASLQCEKLYVFLSYDQKFVDKQNFRDQKILNLKNRILWLKKTYQDLDNIIINFVDETNLASYPDGWLEFSNLIKEKLPKDLTGNNAVFTSEHEYDKELKFYFPNFEHVLVDPDRTVVNISATRMRNSIYENWDNLPNFVKKFYTLKVCIIGTESSGKTTISKYLSKLWNTYYVEEYGAEYCRNFLCGDESLLQSKDLEYIAHKQYLNEQEMLFKANKILFVDTNSFTTEFYHRLYIGKPNDVISSMAKKENYDLIIYMGDELSWVNDGLRLNGHRRKELKDLFESMLIEFNIDKEKIIFINENNYKDRFEKVNNSIIELKKKFENGEI